MDINEQLEEAKFNVFNLSTENEILKIQLETINYMLKKSFELITPEQAVDIVSMGQIFNKEYESGKKDMHEKSKASIEYLMGKYNLGPRVELTPITE